MKCVHCGEELKEGSLFCSKCGKEVQIVPDYNEYEDDYLKKVLAEENRPKTAHVGPMPGAGAGNQAEKNKKQMILIGGIIAACVVIIILGCVVMFGIKNKRANSFDYQVEMAEKAYEEGDIGTAIEYYENALSLDKDNTEIRLILAEIYMNRKDYDSAMILCQEIMKQDSSNAKACEILITIYENQKNYDAILALYEVVDTSLQDQFAAYVVTAPVFSVEGGTYDEYVTLELTTSGEYDIYYSLDGSDPTLRGERYTMPIELNENLKTYTINAVCMNDKGIYSEVVSQEYVIDIPAPDMPIVTPDGGDFGVETTITVTVPDGCSAYYTWDGSDPNIYSTPYTGPITVLEGNNVLSVIIIDNNTQLCSDIYRGNFVFYVEDGEGEDLSDVQPEEEAE